MFQGFKVSFSTNPADIGQLGSILELSSPDESQPLKKESPKKKVATPKKDISLIPQERASPKVKKIGAAKSLIRSFSAVNDSVNTAEQQISLEESPRKRLRLNDQRDVELKEAEMMQAKAHKLGETFITGKKLSEDQELNGVLEKSKKKRKKGRLPSDDSMFRDTIEEIEEKLVIDENMEKDQEKKTIAGNKSFKIKNFFIKNPKRVPGYLPAKNFLIRSNS